MDREYLIFCDESDKTGKFYSNFYGGVMVGSSQYQRITDDLNQLKASLHLHSEIKWAKVSENYLTKYLGMVNAFFEEIEAGHLKVRIMFRPNAYQYVPDPNEINRDPYFLLYYQFIKHGFGLDRLTNIDSTFNLRLYFDTFPDKREKSREFINYLMTLPATRTYNHVHFHLLAENITEVNSKDHVILQCLDIILGSISFRLNEKGKEKLPGKWVRGARTRAKERLYQLILTRIRRIYPGFNIGQSTSTRGNLQNTWDYPYMHWRFIPTNHIVRPEFIKSRRSNNENPAAPT